MASVPVSLMATAAVLLMAAPTGTAAAVVVGHRADPPPRAPLVVTDAHHAALVIHAGARPLVLPPAVAVAPTPPASAAVSASLRRWLDPAVIWTALLGLAAGGIAIGRTRVLQERSSRGGV
jgi:hypothetical protein